MRRAIFALVAGVTATLFAVPAFAAPPSHHHSGSNHGGYSPSYSNYRGYNSGYGAPRYAPRYDDHHHHHHQHVNYGYYPSYNQGGNFGYSGNRVSFWFGF